MLYAGPDQDVYHLSALAFDDAGIGVDLLADVKAILRNRGVAELRFGQDSRHFFPGCPTDVVALSDFLTISGFVGTGTSVDLERDLTGHVATPLPDGEFRYLTAEDYPSLDRFLRREFPGRWHYDVTHKATHDGSRPCVFGLLLDGEVQGFALLQGEGCEIPIGGAVWYASLWESWGSLGPIGVAKHLRGQGFGGALLDHALAQLAADGAKQTIIDWTNLVDFYGKFGFEVTRTYRTFSLRLDEA